MANAAQEARNELKTAITKRGANVQEVKSLLTATNASSLLTSDVVQVAKGAKNQEIKDYVMSLVVEKTPPPSEAEVNRFIVSTTNNGGRKGRKTRKSKKTRKTRGRRRV